MDYGKAIAYSGDTDTISCQIGIIDTYGLLDSKSKNYDRAQFDYNKYQKSAMDSAYNGFVEGQFEMMPYEEIINPVNDIRKIDNIIFIYSQFEIHDEEDKIVRTCYNFFRNGYTIEITGYHYKGDAIGEEVIKTYLNSIRF
jgi:hypothetical protein